MERLPRFFETEAYARFLVNHLTALVNAFEIHGKLEHNFDTEAYARFPVNHLTAAVVDVFENSLAFLKQKVMLDSLVRQSTRVMNVFKIHGKTRAYFWKQKLIPDF